MIVRLSGEDQFRLPESDLERLNELDNAAVEAIDAGEDARFHELWAQMVELVTSDGEPLGGDELIESEIILPPRDITLQEARDLFTGEGLVPDLPAAAG